MNPPPLSLDDRSTTPKQSQTSLPSIADGPALGEDENTDVTIAQGSPSAESDGGAISAASTVRPRMPRIQIQSYLTPLSSIWRARIPSSSPAKEDESVSLEAERTTELSPSDSAVSSSSDETAVSLEISDHNDFPYEDEANGSIEGSSDFEDEDDRQTVRGASVPTTPTAETRSDRAFGAALDSLKQQIRGTGGRALKILSDRDAGSEKHAETTPLRTPPLAR